ncbi:MAG: hypothetical protein N2235_02485 [Fischerella sp.]|nr:hypothetical protein [Fischerella sp.]
MRYNTDQFHYNARTKTFSAEASSLGCSVADPLFGPNGLMLLQSHKTGRTVEFQVCSTRTQDGDLLDWMLHPTDRAVNADPGVRDLRVIVFND